MSSGEKRKHEGGAGDAARRNNKARFYKVAAHSACAPVRCLSSPPTRCCTQGGGAFGGAALPHGACGVMVSADTGRERVTGHNLVELLTEVRRARAPSAVTGLPEVDFPCCVHQAWEEGLPAQPQAAAAPSETKAPPPVADDLLRAEVVRPRCLPRCLLFRHASSEHAACQPHRRGWGRGRSCRCAMWASKASSSCAPEAPRPLTTCPTCRTWCTAC